MRAIPADRPELVSEFDFPVWRSHVGAEPSFVDGRLMGCGWREEGGELAALFEVDAAWHAVPYFTMRHRGRALTASRPAAIGGGKVGFGYSIVDAGAFVSVLDAGGGELLSAEIELERAGAVDFSTRASQGAFVLGWHARTRRGVHSNAGILCVNPQGRRWSADETLLGVCGDVVLTAIDGIYAGETRARALGDGRVMWTRAPRSDRIVRSGVGASEEQFVFVEQPSDRAGGDLLLAIDPRTGADRWIHSVGERVAAVRVERAAGAVALVIRSREETRTAVLGPGGEVLAQIGRKAGTGRMDIIGIDHTHVLWVDSRTLICEKLAGGERAWSLELPRPFHEHQAIRSACDQGRIALRHESKMWLYG